MNEELPELSYQEFVCARKLYRQQEAKNAAQGGAAKSLEKAPLVDEDSKFVLYSAGPEGVFAVFEEFDDAGFFYLYDAKRRTILKAAHIYDRKNVAVEEDIVDIGWAADDSSCGLALWGEFRAFLGISNNVELRKPMTDSEERGIPVSEWPAGFEHYQEQKIE